MEPQGALVLPDEAGTFTVTSSTQSLDAVQKAVAETLGIPWHKVTAGLNLLDSSFCGHCVCMRLLLCCTLAEMPHVCNFKFETSDVEP